MATAALADVDSGYINGEESSSEQNSDREDEEGMVEDEVIDSGMEVKQTLDKQTRESNDRVNIAG